MSAKLKLLAWTIGIFSVLGILGSSSTASTQSTQSSIAIPTSTQELIATPTPEVYQPKTVQVQPYAPQPENPQQEGLDNNNTYVNSQGNSVHSPANTVDGSVPAGASAQCGDGTYSFSQSRRGTCSHHDGVASWL
jgi:hypothetical protein